MTDLWASLQHRLGVTDLLAAIEHTHQHQQRQENIMAKLSDELADMTRRLEGVRDAQAASSANTRDALTRLEAQVTELRDGELDADTQAKVDAIKSSVDDLRTAAESADDGYEPPVVEPAPVEGVEGQPQPGSVEDRNTRGL